MVEMLKNALDTVRRAVVKKIKRGLKLALKKIDGEKEYLKIGDEWFSLPSYSVPELQWEPLGEERNLKKKQKEKNQASYVPTIQQGIDTFTKDWDKWDSPEKRRCMDGPRNYTQEERMMYHYMGIRPKGEEENWGYFRFNDNGEVETVECDTDGQLIAHALNQLIEKEVEKKDLPKNHPDH